MDEVVNFKFSIGASGVAARAVAIEYRTACVRWDDPGYSSDVYGFAVCDEERVYR